MRITSIYNITLKLSYMDYKWRSPCNSRLLSVKSFFTSSLWGWGPIPNKFHLEAYVLPKIELWASTRVLILTTLDTNTLLVSNILHRSITTIPNQQMFSFKPHLKKSSNTLVCWRDKISLFSINIFFLKTAIVPWCTRR